MENKALKRILVMAIVFVMVFSNCGLTIQALATSEGFSFFGFTLFAKNNLDYKVYFLDSDGKKVDEMTADVNDNMTLAIDLEPQAVGYLKSGQITAYTSEGEPNFEFVEVVSLSSKKDGGELETAVQVEQPLLKTDLTVSHAPEAALGENSNVQATQNAVAENTVVEPTNTVPETNTSVSDNTAMPAGSPIAENTVTPEAVVPTEVPETTVEPETPVVPETVVEPEVTTPPAPVEEKAPELSIATPPPMLEYEDTMVDEDIAYQEEVKEKVDEEATVTPTSSSSAKVISGNEILIENIIEPTRIYVKLAYKAKENLKASDLYKNTNIDLAGIFINEKLKEVSVTASQMVTTEWTYTKNIDVTSEIGKISAFEVEGTQGTLVEANIRVSRENVTPNYLPIKETRVEIKLPLVNGSLPTKVDVNASKLKATRGEEINEVTFSQDNWTYDPNTQTITIKVQNPEAVLTSGEDIYKVTCRYDEYVGGQEITVSATGKVTVEEYSGRITNILTKDFNANKTTIVNIGELITYSIGTTEDTINKGPINANYNSVEAVYEEEFVSTVGINILTNDVLKEFTLKDTKEYYIDKDNVELEANEIQYKEVKFRYNELMSLLDEGGIIEIRSNMGELLYTLSKDNAHSQANCEITLNGDIRGVEVSFINVVENGTYTIDFVKALGKCAYDKAAFNNFDKIESRIKAEVKYGSSDEAIPLTPLKTEKYFEKSYTRAELSMNKEELSTVVDNENVEFKIELNNNLHNSDLYINPEFEVVFPSYVQNVELKSVNLLYEDGLVVKNITIFRDDMSILRMKIQLEGVQRTFSTSDVTNGTNIIINARVQIDDYAPRKLDQVKMYYFNQGVSNYQSQTDWKITTPIPDGVLKTTNGFDVEVFTYKAPAGFVTTNSIENYDGLGSSIESVEQGEITAFVEMGETPRPVVMNLAAMNNTGNVCTDVVMLGRVPNTEATDVVTGEKLKTNRNTLMLSGITQADANPIGCDIYYSSNPRADKNLQDPSNGWTQYVEDFTQIKSYLIVPTSDVQPGTVFKFNYSFQIPANLPYEVEIYGSFGAFYNNHSDVAVMYESASADLVGLVTEVGPKLTASLSVDIGDGKDVGECRYLKYTVEVYNQGSVTAEKILIKNEAPAYTVLLGHTDENGYGNDNLMEADETVFTGKYEFLRPGEKGTFIYYLKTTEIPTPEEYYRKTLNVKLFKDEKGYYYERKLVAHDVEDEGTLDEGAELTVPSEKVYVDTDYSIFIENQAVVTAENFGGDIYTNQTRNRLVPTNFDMVVNTESQTAIKPGQLFTYTNDFKNISGKDIKDVEVKITLPDTVDYTGENEVYTYERDVNYSISYDESSRTATVKFDNMKDKELFSVYIGAKGKKGSKNTIGTYFTVKAKDIPEENSYVLVRKYVAPILTATQTTNIVNNVKEDDIVEFITEIKNTGNYEAEDVTLSTTISPNLTNAVVELDGAATTRIRKNPGDVFKYTVTSIKPDSSLIMKVTGKAARLEGTAKNISSTVDIDQANTDNVSANVLNVAIVTNPDLKTTSAPSSQLNDYVDKNTTNAEAKDKNNNNNGGSSNGGGSSNNGGSNSNNGTSNNGGNSASSNSNSNSNNSTRPATGTRSITGQVWLDANRNNRKDDDEKGIADVTVELYQGRNLVKTTKTNNGGMYQFSSLSNGDYTVNFKYDGNVYISSEYKSADVEEDRNSDAMNYSDGTAVTNTITIADLNLENINCGLQERDTFDLKVDKYITKSVVTDRSKSRTVEYDNADLAKIDLHAKTVANSTVDLTYKIIVTNVGNVSGKALKLIDYIPADMQFNGELKENKGWYLGSDGKLYNESLKEDNMAPGETRELTLVLSRKMNSENTGVISNLVEVAEAETSLNVVEKKENNKSTQETILSIRTGGNFVPVTIIFFIMAGLCYIVLTGKLIIKVENEKLKVKFNTKKIYK